jgi:hypothetical protein
MYMSEKSFEFVCQQIDEVCDNIDHLCDRLNRLSMIITLEQLLEQGEQISLIKNKLRHNERGIAGALFEYRCTTDDCPTTQQLLRTHKRLDEIKDVFQVQELLNQIKSRYKPVYNKSLSKSTLLEVPKVKI